MAVVGLALSTLLSGCGESSSQDGEVQYDGTYVPCKRVTLKYPDGTTAAPDPSNPACPD